MGRLWPKMGKNEGSGHFLGSTRFSSLLLISQKHCSGHPLLQFLICLFGKNLILTNACKFTDKGTRKLNFFYSVLCLSASNKQTPVATETFKQSTVPTIGICSNSSQLSAVKRRIPVSSAPTTNPKDPVIFI